jgi:hypothetical protein
LHFCSKPSNLVTLGSTARICIQILSATPLLLFSAFATKVICSNIGVGGRKTMGEDASSGAGSSLVYRLVSALSIADTQLPSNHGLCCLVRLHRFGRPPVLPQATLSR